VSRQPPAPPDHPPVSDHLLATADAALVDLVDHLLNQGVVVSGEVILGLAGIDLIYLRLSVLLCAADRVLPGAMEPEP
jgi:hypothetical protein